MGPSEQAIQDGAPALPSAASPAPSIRLKLQPVLSNGNVYNWFDWIIQICAYTVGERAKDQEGLLQGLQEAHDHEGHPV